MPCHVKGCSNRGGIPGKLAFHRFPRCQKLTERWKVLCQIPKAAKHPRICSSHFTKDAFIRDLPAELLGLTPKLRVKPDAIPSQNLPKSEIIIHSTDTSEDRVYEEDNENPCQSPVKVDACPRGNSRILSDKIKTTFESGIKILINKECDGYFDDEDSNLMAPSASISEENESLEDTVPGRSVKGNKKKVRKVCQSNKPIDSREINLESESGIKTRKRKVISKLPSLHDRILRERLAELQERVNCLELENKRLTEENETLRKEVNENEQNVRDRVSSAVGNFLSKNQIDAVVSGASFMWGKEEMQRILPLLGLSRTWYSFLRNYLQLPLPTRKELESWLTMECPCRLEFVCDVLRLMEAQMNNSSSPDNVCIITLQIPNDTILKHLQPTTKLPMATLKGLLKSWEQPIFIPTEQQFNKDLLDNTITAAEDYGYNVAAVVDPSFKNSQFWSTIVGDHSDARFPNPVDPKRSIWVVANEERLLTHLRRLLGSERSFFVE